MRIIGVDPGVKTGIAVYPKMETRTFEAIEKACDFILAQHYVDAIVMEDYNSYTPFYNQFDKYVYKAMGAIQYAAHYIVAPLVLQHPYIKKKFKGIKLEGWDPVTQHEKDAIFHVEHYRLVAEDDSTSAGG